MRPASLVQYELSDSSSDNDENIIIHSPTDFIQPQAKGEVEQDVTRLLDDLLLLLCGPSSSTHLEDVPGNDTCPFSGAYFDCLGYRDMLASNIVHLKSDDESSCGSYSSSSEESSHALKKSGAYSSDDSDYIFEKIILDSRRLKKRITKPNTAPKTKGELSINDLPKIEDLQIALPANVRLQKLGVVSSIVDTLVVILSDRGNQALDQDTILFTEDRNYFGKVFEIFGPVLRPYYSVRFNGVEDIACTNAKVSTPIFFAPESGEYTKGIFAEQFQHQRGSDASWLDNNEPPAEVLEFSDDEQERQFRAKLKQAKRLNREGENEEEQSSEDVQVIEDGTSHENGEQNGDTNAMQKNSRKLPAGARGSSNRRRARGARRGSSQRPNLAQPDAQTPSNAIYRPSWPPSTSQTSAFGAVNIFGHNVRQTQFYPRGQPWTSTNQTANEQGTFNNYNVNPYTNNDWMWMSEGAFRMPSPRFQTFGRGFRHFYNRNSPNSQQPFFNMPPPGSQFPVGPPPFYPTNFYSENSNTPGS